LKPFASSSVAKKQKSSLLLSPFTVNNPADPGCIRVFLIFDCAAAVASGSRETPSKIKTREFAQPVD